MGEKLRLSDGCEGDVPAELLEKEVGGKGSFTESEGVQLLTGTQVRLPFQTPPPTVPPK